MEHLLKPTPWDESVFGFPTYEVLSCAESDLEEIKQVSGHFTLKVDPMLPTGDLHKHGFYYCDTLVNPYCAKADLKIHDHPAIAVSGLGCDTDELQAISRTAFTHGRFHRDFNITKELADRRYSRWLKQLLDQGTVLVLRHENEVAGFFGYSGCRIVLHALGERFRGKGLSKYFWSAACLELFRMGHDEIHSSISAYNMPVLNLYASLGFNFRNPVNCYHRLSWRPPHHG